MNPFIVNLLYIIVIILLLSVPGEKYYWQSDRQIRMKDKMHTKSYWFVSCNRGGEETSNVIIPVN